MDNFSHDWAVGIFGQLLKKTKKYNLKVIHRFSCKAVFIRATIKAPTEGPFRLVASFYERPIFVV